MNKAYIIILWLVAFACSSRDMYFENSKMSVQLACIQRPDGVNPDSTFAAMSGTTWKLDKPYPSRAIDGPTWRFDLHLAKDDSVTIYYLDKVGTIVGETLQIFLKRGSYTFEPNPFGFPTGVFQNICVIGDRKWVKKVMLMK